ncbi:MAG: hypothetical protein ABL888_13800 [Pirellulaceae bacterium]
MEVTETMRTVNSVKAIILVALCAANKGCIAKHTEHPSTTIVTDSWITLLLLCPLLFVVLLMVVGVITSFRCKRNGQMIAFGAAGLFFTAISLLGAIDVTYGRFVVSDKSFVCTYFLQNCAFEWDDVVSFEISKRTIRRRTSTFALFHLRNGETQSFDWQDTRFRAIFWEIHDCLINNKIEIIDTHRIISGQIKE